jgi:hypothetical protein
MLCGIFKISDNDSDKSKEQHVGFECLTVVTMKRTIFWDVIPHSPAEDHESSPRNVLSLSPAQRMEYVDLQDCTAVRPTCFSSEISVCASETRNFSRRRDILFSRRVSVLAKIRQVRHSYQD